MASGGDTWTARRGDIRRRFERLVKRYDLANTILSLGLDELWRRRAVRTALRMRPWGGGVWVDLASGTGALARRIPRSATGRLVRLDLSPVLLSEAHKLRGVPTGLRVVAESHRIPLRAGRADLVLMGFATRHVPSVDLFVDEIRRILAPGGAIVILDMDLGRGRLWGPAYRFYFRHVLPRIAAVVTGQGETYRWMVRTVEAGPRPEDLRRAFSAAGLIDVRVEHPTGGAAYIASARRRD
ncbi:MAG: methyltransferase domain-containing protein [Candidatus Eisenbacteria bacterium]|nr:methyltransferase domain-containing protein [Candidatus Eisenbacteria bacterium]